MADSLIRLYTTRALLKAVREAVRASDPVIPIQFAGTRNDATDKHTEWVAPHVLSFTPFKIGGSKSFADVGLYQVSCFSRFADDRTDQDSLRPWAIAGIVSDALARKTFPVFDKSPTPVQQGCIFLSRPAEQYLDESLLAKPSTGSTKQASNIHSVILTFKLFFDSSI